MSYSHVPRTMIALLAICCVSCIDESDRSQTVSTGPDTPIADGSAKPKSDGSATLQVVDELPFSAPSDSFGIDSAKVVEDTLQLDLSYGGGCEDHAFAAFWAPVFHEGSIDSTKILITHDARNDRCEAWISQKLAIDLMPLRKAFRSIEPHDDASPFDASEVSITLVTGEQNVVNVRYSLDQHSSGESGKIQGELESPKTSDSPQE